MKCEMMNERCMGDNCTFWKNCQGIKSKEEILNLFDKLKDSEYYTIEFLMRNNTKIQLATKYNNTLAKIDRLNNDLLDMQVKINSKLLIKGN